MGKSRVPLTYEFGSERRGDGEMKVVVGTCYDCGAAGTVTQNGPHAPDAVEQAFRRKGWEFSAWHARECRCPKCVAKRAARRHDPDELLKRRQKEMATVTPIKPGADVPKVASDEAVAAVREPTMREMRDIMAALDSHFDDKAGAYAKGWTDRRIAEELNLPMAMVTRIRREAFGELRAATDIEALRAEARDLFDRLVALDAKIAKLAEQVG
jgi:hypothetical protein